MSPKDRTINYGGSDHRQETQIAFLGPSYYCKKNYPIKQILKKPDLVGRMIAWVVELSKYDITFTPRNRIKSQVLMDFLIQLTSPNLEEPYEQWLLLVDDSSNLKGSGAGIVLKGPWELVLEQYLCFNFQANNNQVEYEAMIIDFRLTKEIIVTHLHVRTDSKLITNQINGEYQTKRSIMTQIYTADYAIVQGVHKILNITYSPRRKCQS